MKKVCLLFFTLFMTGGISLAQNNRFFTAGETYSSDSTFTIVYTNIPDTIITANIGWSSGSHYDYHGTYSFDLNYDNTDDYYFKVRIAGATVGSGRSSRILPINNSFYCISTYDTATVNILNFGDSINNNLVWSNDTNFWPTCLSLYSSYFQQPTIIAGLWFHQLDKFIALKIIVNQDTLFGWVRIDVPDYPKIIVKDYAVKIKNTTGMYENRNETVKIFPNPAVSSLTIITPPSYTTGCLLTIFDSFGKMQITQPIYDTNTHLDTRNLHSGIYFIRITGDNLVTLCKFIKE